MKEITKKVHKAVNFWAGHFARMFPCYNYEELYDEAILKLLEENIDVEKDTESFISTRARCDMLDFIRKDMRQKRLLNVVTTQNEDGLDVNIIETLASMEDHEFQVTSNALLNYLVATAELSDRDKNMLFLLFYKGLTYQEVADKLGLAKSVVHFNVQKALSTLREIYHDSCERTMQY